MQLATFVADRRWVPVVGYVAYVAALSAGYYYNLTFVQLGLIDLGTRLVGMSHPEVSAVMALLALTTLVVAVASGNAMDRRGWSTNLHVKVKLMLGIISVQPAVVGHPLVSLTVGALTALTFLALSVFMAFTLILLPVAIAGLVAGLVAVGHGIIGLGGLVGQRLGPRGGIARTGLATAAGIAVVMVLLELLGALPVAGALMALALLMTGLGAVFITYFGWKEFTPVALPD